MGGGNGCWECNDASHEQQLTDCHCNCHADQQMEVDTPQDQPIAENQMNSGTRSDYFVRIGEHGRLIRRSSQVLALPAQDHVAPPSSAIQQPERGSSSTSTEYGFSFFPFHPFALHKVHLKMKHKHKHERFHGHDHGHEQGRGQGHGHGYGHGEHLLRLPHHHGKHGHHHHKKSDMFKFKVRHGRHFAPQPNLQELLTCGRRAMSVPP